LPGTTGSSSSSSSSFSSSSGSTGSTGSGAGSGGSTGTNLGICSPCSSDSQCRSGSCNTSQGQGFCDTPGVCTNTECFPWGCGANGSCLCHGSPSTGSTGSTGCQSGQHCGFSTDCGGNYYCDQSG